MTSIDYGVIALYFVGLMAVSAIVSRRIRNSEDMFIAGRNSSWWLSGMSTYMTLFSASTFVIWGGVAYRSGLVAVLIANLVGVACFLAGRAVAGRWRSLRIKSPGEFLTVRFGKSTLDFYTIVGLVGRGVHTAVALYAIAVVMSTLMPLAPDNPFADPATGRLTISWAVLLLGAVTLLYTMAGGFLAVLMTDVIQFGVLLTVVLFMIPLSLHEIGGLESFIAAAPEGFFVPASAEYPWSWLVLWLFLNAFMVGGDWPFVQRYISVPTARDAVRSNYLVGVLYLVTPIIWYFPAMAYRIIDPAADPEQAYILMSEHVLMKGMLGVMLAAMVSATLSTVSGTLNVFANVFTYDIYCAKHPDAPQRRQIRIGRLFTLLFGLAILALALLIPYAGGAEKVVVTILTMVIAPLYIPSVWGLFSRRITARHVIAAMSLTYVLGIVLKLTLSGRVNAQLLESTIGLLIPLGLLAAMEGWAARRNRIDAGYGRMRAIVDSEADAPPTAEMRRIERGYSRMAVTCYMATLSAIAVLLTVLLAIGNYDPVLRRIMGWGAGLMFALSLGYLAYRTLVRRREA